jgi:hypothetical protein
MTSGIFYQPVSVTYFEYWQGPLTKTIPHRGVDGSNTHCFKNQLQNCTFAAQPASWSFRITVNLYVLNETILWTCTVECDTPVPCYSVLNIFVGKFLITVRYCLTFPVKERDSFPVIFSLIRSPFVEICSPVDVTLVSEELKIPAIRLVKLLRRFSYRIFFLCRLREKQCVCLCYTVLRIHESQKNIIEKANQGYFLLLYLRDFLVMACWGRKMCEIN